MVSGIQGNEISNQIFMESFYDWCLGLINQFWIIFRLLPSIFADWNTLLVMLEYLQSFGEWSGTLMCLVKV